MTESPAVQIARALRQERTRVGLSISELARSASVAKSTLSQLESGQGNPSVETLWSLANALEVPFSALVTPRGPSIRLVRAGEGPILPSDQANYAVTVVLGADPTAARDLALVEVQPGEIRRCAAHRSNTVEHVIVVTGRLRCGPTEDRFELGPGDRLSYPGDVEHIFEALENDTRYVDVLDY